MIFGNLDSLENIGIYPKSIQKAIMYLKENDLTNKEPGVYEIQGKDMFVQVIDTKTKKRSENKPEVHRKYIDLQCLIHGKEKIGFAIDTGENEIVDEYNSERDILFYKECQGESTIKMVPGSFAVFFPNVVHVPACIDEEVSDIRKIVIKINKEIL